MEDGQHYAHFCGRKQKAHGQSCGRYASPHSTCHLESILKQSRNQRILSTCSRKASTFRACQSRWELRSITNLKRKINNPASFASLVESCPCCVELWLNGSTSGDSRCTGYPHGVDMAGIDCGCTFSLIDRCDLAADQLARAFSCDLHDRSATIACRNTFMWME